MPSSNNKDTNYLLLLDHRTSRQKLDPNTELEHVPSRRPNVARCDSRLVQIEHDFELVVIGCGGSQSGGWDDGHAGDGIGTALVKEVDAEGTSSANEIVQCDLVDDRVLEVGLKRLVDDIPVANLSGGGSGKEGSGGGGGGDGGGGGFEDGGQHG